MPRLSTFGLESMETVILSRNIAPRRRPEPAGKRLLKWTAAALALGALSGMLAGLAARWSWMFELASHFQVQYFWSLAASAAILAGLRRYRLAMLPALVALIAVARIAPFYVRDDARAPGDGAARLRILSFNVYTANRELRSVCNYVRERTPDVAVFYEVDEAWGNQLVGELSSDFPYHKTWADVEVGTRGVAIYSRSPLWDVQFEDLGGGYRAVMAGMIVDSRPVTLIAAHTTSPTTPERLERRNKQLARLAELSGGRSEPVVLVGDLNTTPWSPLFQDLVNHSGLRDSRHGAGVQATWPSALGRLGIPIDHCLVSPEFLVKRCAAGSDVHSDHLPLIVDLVLLDGNEALFPDEGELDAAL